MSHEVASADGRIARRLRNRERVVDAYIELLREGIPNPSASELADRADVTTRTVYRYLSDDVTLKRDVAERIVASFQFLASMPDWRDAPLPERIDAYVTFGLDVYTRTAPIMRVARANFASGPVLAEAVAELRALVREELAVLFGPELCHLAPVDRHAHVVTIHALVLFDSLEYLHEHLDAAGVRATLRRHLQVAFWSIDADGGRR